MDYRIRRFVKRMLQVINTPFFMLKINRTKDYFKEYNYEVEKKKLNNCYAKKTLNVQADNEVICSNMYDLLIIVPAYNAEKWIKRCIDSIIEQKTKYLFKVRIINDGSSDLTMNVLMKYYADISNIEIINQENKGLSGARNTGLQVINAEYVMFVDSDDWLEKNAIEKLMDKAVNFDADIVEGGNQKIDSKGIIRVNRTHKERFIDKNGEELLYGFAWGKVIRSSLFRNIIFPEDYWYEDTIMAYCIHTMAKKIYTISDVVYNYYLNTSGITYTSKTQLRSIETYWISLELWKWMSDNNIQISKSIKKIISEQIIINYDRTRGLGNDILEHGFALTCKGYQELNLGDYDDFDKKYRMLDYVMKNQMYKKYLLICKYWDFL